MDPRLIRLHSQIDNITKYLTPLLTIANCHMVEFITEQHWEGLVPHSVRSEVEHRTLQDVLDEFWHLAEAGNGVAYGEPTSELRKFVGDARKHCIRADDDVCLTSEQMRARVKLWNGNVLPEILVKEFMSPKKSYEIQKMSSLVASLYWATDSTDCIDLGGGKGYLSAMLGLGYGVKCLAVDCDEVALRGGRRRDEKLKKQWPSLIKGSDGFGMSKRENAHRYANVFIDESTDLPALVTENFPEDNAEICVEKNVKILLTGLHTCGDLGPDSLRIFAKSESVAAICNVPCCYHLLTEALEGECSWNCFERDFGVGNTHAEVGFPMSQYLRGYQLGRNARMLAAQSIQRVAGLRQMPARSLHYRAVLQVLLKKYLPKEKIAEGKLKGIAGKCQNFAEYFKMAAVKLELGSSIQLTVALLSDLEAKYECHWQKLVIFYLLRLCLAQVVESLILLDRLLFLVESGFGDKCFIVKLFEPSVSPRCHGIVAVK